MTEGVSPNAGKRWTRDDLILAFNLYCKTPFGRIDMQNPDVIELARLLGRSPASISLKLVNLARLDPALQTRGIRGMSHGARSEVEIWDEFAEDGETLAFESERLLAARTGRDIEADIDTDDISDLEGREREAIVRTRVNQSYFRAMVLARYRNSCCITGLAIPALLVASHIVPWSKEPRERLNPRNGLCLNALHDRAFDRGLITVTADLRVRVGSTVREAASPAVAELFERFDGAPLLLADGFAPAESFLAYHRENVFRG